MKQQIGKYQILEKIGQGGFGDVYLAEDTMLGSQVALKVLAPVYMRDPTGLRHPHIVRIYDLDQDEGVLYLVMDYLPGRSLAEIVRQEGPLPLDRVAGLLTQVASALDYAHEQGLIHRDVKPGNVMVSDEDHASLMDFGLVKAVEHTQFTVLHRTASSEQFTTGGGTIGTPEYMAPEQADPSLGEVGPWTDLYALGVMAYQMIAGRVPFQASTPVATLRAHADLAPPAPSQWVEVPEEVAEIVLRALAKQPGDRWPGAGAFAMALAATVARSQQSKSQEARLATLYTQAEEALDEQRWAQALGLCGQIMAQAPAYRRIGDLFEQANAGLARQREWEAQQEELGALYDQALEQMAARDWDEAIVFLMGIVDASGDYSFRDVPQQLAVAREAQAQVEAGRQTRLETLREESLAMAKYLSELLDKWQALEPGREEQGMSPGAMRDAIDRWLVEQEMPGSGPATEPVSGDQDQEPAATGGEEATTGPIWAQIGIEMVTVPAGEFLYGQRWKRRVYLPEYALAKTPVTNAQYRAFVEATGYRTPKHWKNGQIPKGRQDHPVVNVTGEDAQAFCEWAGCRLPTEQEWEKGARGTDGRQYPWGDKWEKGRCNTHEARIGHTTPVGYYPSGASPYGLLDMVGNVWEWCANRRDEGSKKLVLRGGSWDVYDANARSAVRGWSIPITLRSRCGFRCLVSPTSS
jgi:formylglycine-generating enzyme required for sulfatase activity